MALLHLSISAQEPERVSAFLAQVLGGRSIPFPPFPHSWIAFSQVDDGTAIEIYPVTHRLRAGSETIACDVGEPDATPTFVHAAIGSPFGRTEIIAMAAVEGWLARICNRGPFECVEVWLEGRLLIEVLDPDMQAVYRQGMTMERWSRIFGL